MPENKMEKITTEMGEFICDKICKNPINTQSEKKLEDICAECKLSQYICNIDNTFNSTELVDVLEDVYEYIGISKLYKEFANPDNEFFTDLLLDTSLDEFEKILDNMNKELVFQLFLRATELYQRKELNDFFKIKAIENKVGRPDVFQDIKIED